MRLGLRGAGEVEAAAADVLAAARRGGAKAPKVLVQEMVHGHEVLVGAIVDEQFGATITIRPGGALAEAGDATFVAAPLTAKQARAYVESQAARCGLNADEHDLGAVAKAVEAIARATHDLRRPDHLARGQPAPGRARAGPSRSTRWPKRSLPRDLRPLRGARLGPRGLLRPPGGQAARVAHGGADRPGARRRRDHGHLPLLGVRALVARAAGGGWWRSTASSRCRRTRCTTTRSSSGRCPWSRRSAPATRWSACCSSIVVLGERPSALAMIGIGCSIVGAVLVSTDITAMRAGLRQHPPGLWWAVASAIGFGVAGFTLGVVSQKTGSGRWRPSRRGGRWSWRSCRWRSRVAASSLACARPRCWGLVRADRRARPMCSGSRATRPAPSGSPVDRARGERGVPADRRAGCRT